MVDILWNWVITIKYSRNQLPGFVLHCQVFTMMTEPLHLSLRANLLLRNESVHTWILVFYIAPDTELGTYPVIAVILM